MLLHEIIDNAARAEPGGVALVAEGRRWSFGELRNDVQAFADALSTLIEPGERVAVVAENRAAYVAALYAVPAAGGVLVFANARHTIDELVETVARSHASVLIGTADHLDRLAAPELPTVTHRICLDDSAVGSIGISELLSGTRQSGQADRSSIGREREGDEGSPRGPDAPVRSPEDLAWLLFTSGTTGRAKGAMLTHHSIIAAALNTTMARPVAEDEVYLFPFPLFHVAAYNVVHHHLRRRPVVLLPRFDALRVMSAIEEERVTSVSLAPTMLAMLLDHPDRVRFDLSSLRTVSYGAAPMPRDLLHRVLAEWPQVGLAQGYGMTELSGNAVFLSPEDHRRAATDHPDLLTAAGRPGPLAALRIVDDRGCDRPAGDPGEILVRGDQVCAGYWQDPEATAAAITDGWLHTGDVGRMDDRGYLHVVDRKKDIIITGGENVSSREVEDALGTHPAVASVAVVGIPDGIWGERVVAVVVPVGEVDPPTLDDLRTHVADLAGFKHPRAVVLVEALPTNASGKVDKVALRDAVGTDG